MTALRWPLALWLLVVLLAHWFAWGRWQQARWEASQLPPIERLKVELRQPMRLQAPVPPAPLKAQAQARRLDSPTPAVRPPDLPDIEQPAPLPEPKDLTPPPDLPPELGHTPDATPGVEWPLSVRLRYALHGEYNGPVHGDAEVEWLRQDLRYQVRLRVQIGPRLTPLVRRDLISEGLITPQGVSPQRYDEETQLLLGSARRVSVQLRDGQILLPGGGWRGQPPGVQDSASQFVQLAWLFLSGNAELREGTQIELPLALPNGLFAWRYQVVGSERLESPLGRLETWHLQPKGVSAPGALQAEVWLAPELQFMPMQILITHSATTWVRLTLAEPPMQEDAPSPSPAASEPPP